MIRPIFPVLLGMAGLGMGGCGTASITHDTAGPTGLEDEPPKSTDELPRNGACPATTPWIARISGTVQDAFGMAVGEVSIGFCIHNAANTICVDSPPTRANGTYEIEIPESVRCMEHAVLRAHSSAGSMATTYCAVGLPLDRTTVQMPPLVLHQTTPALDLPPLDDPSAPRTVVFSGGLEVDVTPSQYDGPYEALAATTLDPGAAELCFVNDPSALTRVYGFRVEGDFGEHGKSLTFPFRVRDAGLPPGTPVALYVQGGVYWRLADNTPVPEAEWVQYGTGVIDADGILTGDQLPFFNWFGYGPS